jgi:hypothetical protein
MFGIRVRRQNRHPPEGAKLIRDTPVTREPQPGVTVGFTRASLHYLRLQPCLLSGSPGRCGALSDVAAQ